MSAILYGVDPRLLSPGAICSPLLLVIAEQELWEPDAEYDEFCHPSIILAERVTEYLLLSY